MPFMNRLARWLVGKMDARALQDKALAHAIGAANSSVGNWKKGAVVPDGEKLLALAEYFQSDPVDLFRMAYDLPASEGEAQLGKREIEFLEWFRTLPSDEARERVFHFLETLSPNSPLMLGDQRQPERSTPEKGRRKGDGK